jgi:hypothetical protein
MTSEPPWPITNPELHERLRLDEDGFLAFMQTFLGTLGAREFTPDVHERALGYPWERPTESFVLRDDQVEPFDPALRTGRHALLAIGSNAAPWRLAGKLAHFEDAEDRLVAVECGPLEDYDVGPVPTVTAYGSMPATLFASPGTSTNLAVLWVNEAQLTLLTWSEISYRFGRLSDVRFAGRSRTVYAYVSRMGTFAPDGVPLALAAVPASHRSAPALTQSALLDRVAGILGHGDGETLVRRIFEDTGAVYPKVITDLWPLGQPFADDRWTPFT